MIAIDTQILVYSLRKDSPHHRAAAQCVRSVAEGNSPWAICWASVHEFIGIVTHPKIYKPPTPLSDALQQVANWMESPSLRLLSEPPGYFDDLALIATHGRIHGPLIHDARIVAICRANGVRELWTADRDFSRFPGIVLKNPL